MTGGCSGRYASEARIVRILPFTLDLSSLSANHGKKPVALLLNAFPGEENAKHLQSVELFIKYNFIGTPGDLKQLSWSLYQAEKKRMKSDDTPLPIGIHYFVRVNLQDKKSILSKPLVFDNDGRIQIVRELSGKYKNKYYGILLESEKGNPGYVYRFAEFSFLK